MLPMMIAQAAGGLMSAYGAMQQQKEKERIEEEYNRKAYADLLKSGDTAKNLNPQATANAATARVMEAQTAALNQASNVGAGMAANSGLGGDVVANNISTAKAMQPIAATAAQYGGQLAQIEQNAYGDQLNRQQAMSDNASRIASLSQNVNYNYSKKPTLLDAVGGAMAGINAGTNAFELMTGNGSAGKTMMAPDSSLDASVKDSMTSTAIPESSTKLGDGTDSVFTPPPPATSSPMADPSTFGKSDAKLRMKYAPPGMKAMMGAARIANPFFGIGG